MDMVILLGLTDWPSNLYQKSPTTWIKSQIVAKDQYKPTCLFIEQYFCFIDSVQFN